MKRAFKVWGTALTIAIIVIVFLALLSGCGPIDVGPDQESRDADVETHTRV